MSELVARALLEIGAIGFSPENPIRFKSGILSPVYVDNRRLPFYPAAWKTVIEGFQDLMDAEIVRADVIAGMAMGGVPHSAALAYALERPSVFVRKEPKEHGKGQQIEGGDVQDKHVILIEDLVTTGGSSLSGVKALREAGAHVETVISIVSYGFGEAETAFAEADVTLFNLVRFETILRVALEDGRFDEQTHASIEDWFKDPHGWANRHQRV